MTIIAPPPVETTVQSPLGEIVPMTRHRFGPSPLNRRRWQNFRSNRRGYWSFWIFMILFFVSLFAELIANDRPFLIKFDGHLYWPAFVSYSETTFGGDFETAADYRDPYLQKLIADKGGTIVWPLIRYSYDTHNLDLPTPAPSKPTWMLTEAQCKDVVVKKGLNSCRDLEYNWLGTDDQGRDVVARLIYGLFRRLDRPRLSALHRSLDRDSLALSALDHIIGAAARLLRAARHSPAVLLGIAGRPGARGIPARAQFRIHHGGAGARRLQCRDHVPASFAECHGGDHDVPPLHRIVVGDDADGA